MIDDLYVYKLYWQLTAQHSTLVSHSKQTFTKSSLSSSLYIGHADSLKDKGILH